MATVTDTFAAHGTAGLTATGTRKTFATLAPMSGQSGLIVNTFDVPTLETPGVLAILSGGPLDGEYQRVENLPTTPGTQLLLSVPHYQTFDPSQPTTEVVLSQGLEAVYALVGQGPAPDTPGNNPLWGDNWVSSWIFDFTGTAYIPAPPPVVPPGGTPPAPLVQVWMIANSTLTPDSQPIIITPTPWGVVAMEGDTDLDVDADVTPWQYGVVALSGETVMSVVADWNPQVPLIGNVGLTVVGTGSQDWPKVGMRATASLIPDSAQVHMSATAGMTVKADPVVVLIGAAMLTVKPS